MRQIQGKVKFIAVSVPGDANKVSIECDEDGWYLAFRTVRNRLKLDIVDLPKSKSQYKYFGKLSELTEEQCAELVGKVSSTCYKDYLCTKYGDNVYKLDAISSLKSLLQSNGLSLKSWVEKLDIDIDYNREELTKYEQKLSKAADDFLIILIH